MKEKNDNAAAPQALSLQSVFHLKRFAVLHKLHRAQRATALEIEGDGLFGGVALGRERRGQDRVEDPRGDRCDWMRGERKGRGGEGGGGEARWGSGLRLQ
jgi:hypothetical protein